VGSGVMHSKHAGPKTSPIKQCHAASRIRPAVDCIPCVALQLHRCPRATGVHGLACACQRVCAWCVARFFEVRVASASPTVHPCISPATHTSCTPQRTSFIAWRLRLLLYAHRTDEVPKNTCRAWCVAILLRHAVRERGKRHPVSACQHGRTPARTLIALCVSHWSDRPQPGSSCVRAQAPKNAQCGVWCVTVSIVQSAYVTACLCYSLQHHSNGAIQRHSCMTQVLWSYFNPNDRVRRCLYHRVCGDDHNFVECESRREGRYPSCTKRQSWHSCSLRCRSWRR
jgi:hypothetical protein